MSPLFVHVALLAALALLALLLERTGRKHEWTHLAWLPLFVKLLVPPFVEAPVFPADQKPAAPILAPRDPIPVAVDRAPATVPLEPERIQRAVVDLERLEKKEPSGPRKDARQRHESIRRHSP